MTLDEFEGGLLQTVLHWVLAACAVLCLHGAAVWFALNWKEHEQPPGGPPPAVMIDLAPPAAPSPIPDAVPDQAVQEAQPEPEPDLPDIALPEPPPPVDSPPVIEPLPPEPIPDPVLPELPPVPNAAAILAPPPLPRPQPARKVERPDPPRKPVEPRPRPQRKPMVKQTTAPPTTDVQPSRPSASVAAASAASSGEVASWRNAMWSRINRFKTTPSGVRSGRAVLSFTISEGGQIISPSITQSSGQPALDQAALRDLQRASPLPSPPPGVSRRIVLPWNVR